MIVPDQAVKSLLMKSKLGEYQGKWIAILQEFDLEIHLMKLVRGQGLSQAMAIDTPHIQCWKYTLQSFTQDPWYTDLAFILLNNKCHEGLTTTQR